MSSRGCEIQLDWIGIGNNKSFGRAPLLFFSVRLEHLGHIGAEFADLFGGSTTWDQLGNLIIKWGTNEEIKYHELKTGWTYWWEIGTWDFTVTDDLGNKTTTKVETISDLGITWDILESPQFSIHFSAKYENDAFLNAWRYKRGVKPVDLEYPFVLDKYTEIPQYLWGEFDKYLNDIMHIKFSRLIDRVTVTLTGVVNDTSMIDLDLSSCVKSVISTKVTDFSSSGNFDISLIESSKNEIGEKKYREANAESYIIGNLLMIRLFASISDMSKPVFEPWMLWQLWQWFGNSGVTIKRDRVFDLSPCWG